MEQAILEIENKHWKDVYELAVLNQQQVDATAEEMMNKIKTLQERRIIRLEGSKKTMPTRFRDYLFSSWCLWFWITLVLVGSTIMFVCVLPRNETALLIARYLLSFIFLTFLPGYCLTEALFPLRSSLDEIERFTFSVGLSLATTMLTGLLLSFTPFGISLVSVVTALSFIILLFASIALTRKHKTT